MNFFNPGQNVNKKIIAISLMLIVNTHLAAQNIAQVTFVQQSSRQDVDQNIVELQNASSRLKAQLNEIRNSQSPDLPQANTFESTDATENQKVLEIRKNLQLLQKVIQEKKAKKETAEAERAKRKSMMNFPVELEADTDAMKEKNESNPESAGLSVPKKVLDKIVNAFELGNSLFLAGNIDQAIKYYEIVPADKLSASERNWLEFMIANCHQRKGDYELAEARFRSVAGFKDSPRLAQSARESLKYIVSRKRLSGIVSEYSSKADDAIAKAGKLIGGAVDGK